MNELLNTAIKEYLARGRKERSREANLASLRAYRKKACPRFQKEIGEFVEAEATLSDPVEGEIVDVQPGVKGIGPVQRKIRNILSNK